jgi:hypothetical protein
MPDWPPVATSITRSSATLGATVNPEGREVTTCEVEYGQTTSYGSAAPCAPAPGSGKTPVPVTASTAGLSVNTTHHYRVTATNPGGRTESADRTFKTLPYPPTVETGGYLSSPTPALTGAVDPNGVDVTECRFEYGDTDLYGHSVLCEAPPGSGEEVVEVSAPVQGLSEGGAYHFRIVVTNAGGTSHGSDQPFTASPGYPVAVTGAASSISQTTAIFNASVNPHGFQVTECRFEYGSIASYGASAPCNPAPGSGSSTVAVSAAIGGLTANSTYHYRIVASDSGKTSHGNYQTFTTSPTGPAITTKSASAITQTSATQNATVNPNGAQVTNRQFEYGPTETYGTSEPCNPSPGAGQSPVAVSAQVTGLTVDTVYQFRIGATNANGTSEGVDETFTTHPTEPAITGLGPNAGLESGGTTVSITGTNLARATAVRFGLAEALVLKANSPRSLTALSPPGAAGAVEVTVTTSGGTSEPSPTASFSYVAPGPSPAIKKLSPKKAPMAGGSPVTITGTGFNGVTAVKFGTADATSFHVNSATSIAATAPAGAKGSVEVSVTTPNGTTPASRKARFTYRP